MDWATVGKYKLLVDLNSEPGLKQFQNGINYEKHIRAELERLIPGCKGCFLDIGANAGIHSVSAKDIDPSVQVVAVEVSEKNIQNLCRTVVENKFENFWIIPVAASDTRGIIRKNSDHDNTACCSTDMGGYDELWPCFPLGFFNIPTPAVIKIDVEGLELNVFKGITHFLTSKPKPVVIFEYTPCLVQRCGATPVEMLSFLTRLGYKLTVLDYAPGIRRTFTDAAEVVAYVDSLGHWVLDIMAHE